MMARPEPSDAVVVDFETFADKKAGYTLTKMSTREYIEDSRFDILSIAIAQGLDDEIAVYSKHGPEGGTLEDARRVLEMMVANAVLVGHNLDFDGLVLALRWGIRFDRTFDTTGWLRYRGYGASLANGAHVVGLEKDDAPTFDEAALLDPAKFERFAIYNANDTEVARAIFHAAIADEFFTPLEFWASHVTTRENLRGIRIDRSRAATLEVRFAKNRDSALGTICQRFPTFDTSKLRSSLYVRAFIKQSFGIQLESLDKRDAVLAAVKTSDTEAGHLLRLREAFDTWERHSKKCASLARGPGRIYGQLHYYGAHTGRFTGGGTNAERVNLQNLHKGRDDDFEDLGLIRTIVVADDDESWVSSDLSTIEPRVLAFLAGQQDLVARFASDEDVYTYFISEVFPGVPIVKNGENDHLRQLGKKAVLGLGYGQGEHAFFERLRAEDPSVTQELAARVHRQYGQKFSRITKLRWKYFDAFRRAADTASTTRLGGCAFRRVDDPRSGGGTVEVLLPTGRLLTYRSTRTTFEMSSFGRVQRVYWYADDYQFDATQKGTRGGSAKKVKGSDNRLRAQLRPQTLIENIVSAVARDIIVGQMFEIEEAGLRIKFSVHDEAVVSTPRCRCPTRDRPTAEGVRLADNHDEDCGWTRARGVVKAIMSKVPTVFPKLDGLPVACELSDGIRDSYGK